MNSQEAIAYLKQPDWNHVRPGLERTRVLLQRLGNPQNALRFIHVAGTNGKGSTCAMLDAILRTAGYRTGLYISPELQYFGERMRVNGCPIGGSALARLTERVRAAAEAMSEHPSQFEMMTALAFLYFAEQACDLVVLEVGMGGEFDSTNVIAAPEVAVITNIGLDHTAYLGHTLAEIASAKAGIIKPGTQVVCYDSGPESLAVFQKTAREKGAALYWVDFTPLEPLSQTLDGQRFRWKEKEYFLSLLGAHQLRNAAVVLETVQSLRSRGFSVNEAAIYEGLRSVRWPARLEVLQKEPLFLLDGAHNPQGIEALVETLSSLCPKVPVVFLVGVLADKDYPRMMELLLPLAKSFHCLTPPDSRALPAEELAAFLRRRGARATAYSEISQAMGAARKDLCAGEVLVAGGSLYLVGKVRAVFQGEQKAAWRRKGLEAREGLSAQERAGKSAAICAQVRQFAPYQRAKTVLLYRAVRAEVSLEALRADNKRWVYPRCGENGQLELFLPCEEGPQGGWKTGPFGILEPDPATGKRVWPEEVDLVLCPCVAFDAGGARLGMGGGYYDRFLSECDSAEVALVAFEAQRGKDLPQEMTDIRIPWVITEAGCFAANKEK